jgi:RimJ/RimL family protein N-acetyltransferase
MADSFVPADFRPPPGLVTDRLLLEPLGPQHNESDYQAWTSSMEHIRATAGFPDGRWPHPMSLEENRGDLERHAHDFEQRTGFTYTVLDPDSREVIGCLYIYPTKAEEHDADVRMWVRASRADLDGPLWDAVSAWLARDWPFSSPHVPGRI